MRVHRLGVAASILCALIQVSAAAADEVDHAVCALILHEERGDVEDAELAVDLAESHLAAAESIFELVDALWKEELIERLNYLFAKHRIDVAVIDVKRRALLLERQEALIEHLEIICSPPGDKKDKVQLDAAHRRYLQADCLSIGKNLAIAEIELAYASEVLAGYRDLRENGVATAQDVILREEDVETARRQIAHYTQRVQACTDSGAAGGNGSR